MPVPKLEVPVWAGGVEVEIVVATGSLVSRYTEGPREQGVGLACRVPKV